MTPEIFAFIVMPGLIILTGIAGYAIIVLTDPAKKAEAPAVGDLFNHRRV